MVRRYRDCEQLFKYFKVTRDPVCEDHHDLDISPESSAEVGRAWTCRHSCLHHALMMDPSIWRNLPEELVAMVFARLPLIAADS